MSLFSMTPPRYIFLTRECRKSGKTFTEYKHLNKPVKIKGEDKKTNGITYFGNEIEDLKYFKVDSKIIECNLEPEDIHEYDIDNRDTFTIDGDFIEEYTIPLQEYIDDFWDTLREYDSKKAIDYLNHHFTTTSNKEKFLDVVSEYIEGELTPNSRKAKRLKNWLDSFEDKLPSDDTPIQEQITEKKPSHYQIALFLHYKVEGDYLTRYLESSFFDEIATQFGWTSRSSGEKIQLKYNKTRKKESRLNRKTIVNDLKNVIKMLSDFPLSLPYAEEDLTEVEEKAK